MLINETNRPIRGTGTGTIFTYSVQFTVVKRVKYTRFRFGVKS